MSMTTHFKTGTQPATGESSMEHWLIAALRIGVAFLWIENAGWKRPPDFSSLRRFTEFAITDPVAPPFSWLVENVVLPNLTFFGWMTLLLEASLGAFLLLGLATRLWALIGIAQSVTIMMSVLNAPNEWEWSFYLMILAHLALFATAAGRSFGLDAVLRPRWAMSPGVMPRLLMRCS
jgi:thiosulfate dehydrogenase [quinone] large subunit